MGTNYVPLIADLFLFGYERDFMKSLMVQYESFDRARSAAPGLPRQESIFRLIPL